ncbi:MAG: BMP family ABC transporter substrate-binding protein [Erysipelotrichaceae bacterium]|nr:BMP family ABC transporter substrate-binding protein [Erysipelotrichaceae bacterium]
MKKLLTILLVVLMAFSFAGCGKEGEGDTPKPADDVKKVVVLLPFTGDNSYFDTLARGVETAKTQFAGKVEVELVEVGNTQEKATWDAAFDEYCEDGKYDLVVSGNNSYEEFLFAAAKRYPDQMFMNFDYSSLPEGWTEIPGNVYCVTYALDDLGYVVGALSAALTKTNKVGVVVGMSNQAMDQFIGGWCQILEAQGKEYYVRYASDKVSTGFFANPGVGKEITDDLVKAGCDVVWQVAGGTGAGVIQSCAENGVWAVGVDQDQYAQFIDTQPDWAAAIVTSALKNSDVALVECIRLLSEGKFREKLGKSEAWGIALNGVGIAENDYYKEKVPADIQAAVKDTLQQVTDGKVEVVDTMEMTPDQWQQWHDTNTTKY